MPASHKRTKPSPRRTPAKPGGKPGAKPAKAAKAAPKRGFAGIPLWAFWAGGLGLVGAYLLLVWHFLVGPNSFSWKPFYPEGFEVRGIDVSHYQEEIDWDRLCNATLGTDPIRFVFIKATEGESLLDDNFNANFYESRQHGFVRGTYHFFVPGTDPGKQARFYLHQVHLEPGDLPPVLDVETIGKLSTPELRQNVKTWLDIVEKHYGVKPILYSGYKFRMQHLSGPEFEGYPYWIAHYHVPRLEYKGQWAFWQHTDCGRADGIQGPVDCNIFNGSFQDLLQLTIQE